MFYDINRILICILIFILIIFLLRKYKKLTRKIYLSSIVLFFVMIILSELIKIENLFGFSSIENSLKYAISNNISIQFSVEAENNIIVGYLIKNKKDLNITFVKKKDNRYLLPSNRLSTTYINKGDLLITIYHSAKKNNKYIEDSYILVNPLNNREITSVLDYKRNSFIKAGKYFILHITESPENFKIYIDGKEYIISTNYNITEKL